MAAILAHFRFLKRRHRRKKPNLRKPEFRRSAAKKFALQRDCDAWPMSDIRPEMSSDGHELKNRRKERKQKISFRSIMR